MNVKRFTQDGECIEILGKGHSTLFPGKGSNGKLCVYVRIVDEIDRWNIGKDVYSMHSVKLSDALEGCNISIPTVQGSFNLNLPAMSAQSKFTLSDKGMTLQDQTDDGSCGNHIANVHTQVPRNLND